MLEGDVGGNVGLKVPECNAAIQCSYGMVSDLPGDGRDGVDGSISMTD